MHRGTLSLIDVSGVDFTRGRIENVVWFVDTVSCDLELVEKTHMYFEIQYGKQVLDIPLSAPWIDSSSRVVSVKGALFSFILQKTTATLCLVGTAASASPCKASTMSGPFGPTSPASRFARTLL